MRLIKLKVKNIASLKGEHLINFAQVSYHSPLFAITGETGAGKSSILNSIGLVLYGKVYKSNVTQNDLVTLGEKEGQIELIFQAKGKTYLAFWRAKVRKQNGELYSTPQTPQRELYVLEGDEFDSPKTILTLKTEELLNLDFDQFCKCIILNQGEFARFLSSSFTERKEILEKLYPGEMLESLSRELKLELDTLQKQKNDLDIELAALKGDGPQLEDLTELKNKLETEYKLHESWFNQLESIDYHYVSLNSYHAKFIDTQFKIDSVKSSLSKETTVFNELLTVSQKANEEFFSAQQEQEKQLPGLQELLKSEETLKHQIDLKLEQEKQLDKLKNETHTLRSKLETIAVQMSNWEAKSKDLLSNFTLPLNDLKNHSRDLEVLFDLYANREMLLQELNSKNERLGQLEVEGKEISLELKTLQNEKSTFEEDKQALALLEIKKKEALKGQEEKQKAILLDEALKAKIDELNLEASDSEKKSLLYTQELAHLKDELIPLETTIKLQALLSAVEVCITHPSLEESKACPVCRTSLPEAQILSLKNNLEKTDFTKIKARESELTRLMMKKESEINQLTIQLQKLKTDLTQKNKDLQDLQLILASEIPNLESLDEEIKALQKKVWAQEKVAKDEERLTHTLNKTREQYVLLKKDITAKTKSKQQLDVGLTSITSGIPFIDTLTIESVNLLKTETRLLTQYVELETQGEKLKQEQSFVSENLRKADIQQKSTSAQLTELNAKISTLNEILDKELKGKKASELIQELAQKVKEKADSVSLKERELKGQELRLKESQSRLYTLEELIKEIDLHFTKELHTLKTFSQVSLPRLSDELSILTTKLGSLGLELKSPHELFVPLKDLIESQKTFYKEKTSELKMSFASVRARLEDWEKRQDRISLLILKSEDLTKDLDRRARLYEVLGKDELRTFVLSLVEENLITQTNDELQKLCQGRYEIVHQSRRMKLTPEFYILDKFREGGLRKVSTLSGGETFMVSLAMALGLAEMTRGTAEIDSLFIDEGFGTLDQESLEDVLDMLKQIQTRGLMVGIISHVKALTNALPVNLLVTKKQDGTSSVGIVHN